MKTKKLIFLIALALITLTSAFFATIYFNDIQLYSYMPDEYRIDGDDLIVCYKPVIYLYPQEETQVSVKLDVSDFTVTYPDYNDGWNVTARPDGTLFTEDGSEYSYLFWEAKTDAEYDFSEGFCVKGEDTAEFLRRALSAQGLTPREYNEFIVYWYPLMKDNAYNVISFQTTAYEQSAALSVTPKPDAVKRVFMAYYASDKPVELPAQQLCGFEREGFTVVEWGGTQISFQERNTP
ncbi:MAG: hypothetical protein ACI4Q4_06105 [Oscillospiraceae bacterium]